MGSTLRQTYDFESACLSRGFYTEANIWLWISMFESQVLQWGKHMTLNQHVWVTGSTMRQTYDFESACLSHRFYNEANIWHKFDEITSWGKGDMKRAQNSYLLKALTLSKQGWVKNFAHVLTKAKIRPQYNENPSRAKRGYGADKKKSRINPMAFDCDLYVESAWLTYNLHIISLERTFDQSLMNIFLD